MPKIYLKPNSPEFDHAGSAANRRGCDMPECRADGDFRAPRDRSLSEYYHFCKEHICEYNKAWNFFEGMAAHEVEDFMHRSLYGDRPTWKYGVNGNFEALYDKAWQTYTGQDEPKPKRQDESAFGKNSPEFEALAIMGLEPPVTLADVKRRYKELAKKHHPDLNKNDKGAEELLKKINMSYTILKLAYEKFDQLPARS